ncbi:MAG TPA: CHAD domain-containing protein, partial [Terriglobia bacterium]|nr:CHAD domain-containing protein [Terriglobia bacterium]
LEWATVRKLALKQLNRFMALEPKVLRGDEPDALHDMRVASRRLQQILDLIYPKPRPHTIRGLRKKIQRSRRCLSEVRNCDVLIARVERELANKRASRREARQALLQFLHERRTANFEKALKKLGKINLAVFYVEMRRTLGDVISATPLLPHPHAAGDAEELTPALLCRRLAESFSSVWGDFEAKQTLSLDDPQPSAVHGTRIATKRLRYLLEVVEAFEVAGSRENLAWLRSLQRLLGEWHDLEVLEQTMIEMVARPDFLRERLDLAMGVEKLILRNRTGKKKMQEKYFQMVVGSPESARLKEWVNYLVSSPSEAFGAPAA